MSCGRLALDASPLGAAARTSPTLLITADPTIGLTRDAIDHVIAWAKTLDAH